MRSWNSAVPLIRGAVLIAVFAWGWYLGALFRTSDWGYHDPIRQVGFTFYIIAVMALPLALIPLAGLPVKAQLKPFALLTFAVLFSVEVFARAQERLVVRRFNASPTRDYIETRWWPFAYHSLGVQQGKWWGCD